MWQLLVNWVRKKCGYHICEEFTQWHQVVHRSTLVPKYRTLTAAEVEEMPVNIEYWQERTCTLCGKLYTEKLPS